MKNKIEGRQTTDLENDKHYETKESKNINWKHRNAANTLPRPRWGGDNSDVKKGGPSEDTTKKS